MLLSIHASACYWFFCTYLLFCVLVKENLLPRPLKIALFGHTAQVRSTLLRCTIRVTIRLSIPSLNYWTRSQCHEQILESFFEIEHSDWRFQVTWRFVTNESALFHRSAYDITSRASSHPKATFYNKILKCKSPSQCRAWGHLSTDHFACLSNFLNRPLGHLNSSILGFNFLQFRKHSRDLSRPSRPFYFHFLAYWNSPRPSHWVRLQDGSGPVWPDKNSQMSMKVAQKWFH